MDDSYNVSGWTCAEGIIALTLIYDYAQNKDFAPQLGPRFPNDDGGHT